MPRRKLMSRIIRGRVIFPCHLTPVLKMIYEPHQCHWAIKFQYSSSYHHFTHVNRSFLLTSFLPTLNGTIFSFSSYFQECFHWKVHFWVDFPLQICHNIFILRPQKNENVAKQQKRTNCQSFSFYVHFVFVEWLLHCMSEIKDESINKKRSMHIGKEQEKSISMNI